MDCTNTTLGTSHWISCGWQLANPELSAEENRLWYGDFYSATGAGGNFLVQAFWRPSQELSPEELEKGAADSDSLAKTVLEPWDHSFLNDVVGKGTLVTPENMALVMEEHFSKSQPAFGRWTALRIQFSKDHMIYKKVANHPERVIKGRLQSLIVEDAANNQFVGVDGALELVFQGSIRPSTKTTVPFSEVQHWLKKGLPDQFLHQSLDEWLGIKQKAEIPEALYAHLQKKWSNLMGVNLQFSDGISLGYSAKDRAQGH